MMMILQAENLNSYKYTFVIINPVRYISLHQNSVSFLDNGLFQKEVLEQPNTSGRYLETQSKILYDIHFTLRLGILGQVWYLIVLITDLCTLTYFDARGHNPK